MEQIFQDSENLSLNWAEIIRLYSEIMDDEMPYLSTAKQIIYQRFFHDLVECGAGLLGDVLNNFGEHPAGVLHGANLAGLLELTKCPVD